MKSSEQWKHETNSSFTYLLQKLFTFVTSRWAPALPCQKKLTWPILDWTVSLSKSGPSSVTTRSTARWLCRTRTYRTRWTCPTWGGPSEALLPLLPIWRCMGCQILLSLTSTPTWIKCRYFISFKHGIFIKLFIAFNIYVGSQHQVFYLIKIYFQIPPHTWDSLAAALLAVDRTVDNIHWMNCSLVYSDLAKGESPVNRRNTLAQTHSMNDLATTCYA